MNYQFVFNEEALNLLKHSFVAVREMKREERDQWITDRVKSGENMMDCAGESILPPMCFRLDILGKEIRTDKVLTKVPFKNDHYRDFINYGSIKVSDVGKDNWETYYLHRSNVALLKELGQKFFDLGRAAKV
jgi:hypothetical protein